MKKICVFLTLIFLSSYLLIFPAKAADVNVSAIVDSKVSKSQSDIDTNTTHTLADPASHSILLTIILKDADGNPMPNILVVVTSSRGQVDIIEAVNKLAFGESPNRTDGIIGSIGGLAFGRAQAAEINDMQKDITDENGQVQFRVTSFIAGEAVFTVVADTLVTLDPIKVTFEPLPFPANITISVKNPLTGKEITLYSPPTQDESLPDSQTEAQKKTDVGTGQANNVLSPLQSQSKKLVNTGTKVQISFWAFAIPILLILLCPLFIVLSFINLRKMRWMAKEQTLLLKKMFPPDYNRQAPPQS